jgi:hypothetical protein
LHPTLQNICTSLETTAKNIKALGHGSNTYAESYGWNCISLTQQDLVELATSLAADIKKANVEKIDETFLKKIEHFGEKFIYLNANTIPHLGNGNVVYAGPAYVSTIQTLRSILHPLIFPVTPPPPPWETLADNKALPPQLTKRLRSIQAELDQILPEKEALEAQVKLIREAHETAESLPIDMKSLSDARIKVDKYATDAGITFGKIDEKHKEALKLAEEILKKNDEAADLVSSCEQAYQITTTKGLAAAFEQRATALNGSMWIWVVGLLIALIVGALVGAHRVDQLNEALALPDAKAGLIWIQVTLSLLSVGAPLWFAWLATKQIGHRFKLAEDYAFKASFAKAYEGYRKQAINIDPKFEARLFSSALTRLEEAPLRFVEAETHGSPWHEFLLSRFNRKNGLNTIVNEGEAIIEKVIDPITPPATQ